MACQLDRSGHCPIIFLAPFKVTNRVEQGGQPAASVIA
jgi:hypothetical protein